MRRQIAGIEQQVLLRRLVGRGVANAAKVECAELFVSVLVVVHVGSIDRV